MHMLIPGPKQNVVGGTWHLDVYSIELVEAGPSTARGQSLEELPHGNVIQTVGAVEHHALHRQCLRQILRRFRLASTGRTFCLMQQFIQQYAKRRVDQLPPSLRHE